MSHLSVSMFRVWNSKRSARTAEDCMFELADRLEARGEFREAERLYKECLKGRRRLGNMGPGLRGDSVGNA